MYARIFSTVNYTGVANTGVQDDKVYASSKLSLLAMDFNLFDYMAMPLCDDTSTYIVAASDNNADECPGDGQYDYTTQYRLPNAGAESASWLATGWQGSGYIKYYADADASEVIGSCKMTLKTYVTHNTTSQGLVSTPSAAETAALAVGAFVVLVLLGLWCFCCTKRRRQRRADQLAPGDDVTSQFRRMYEEDDLPRSIVSGGGGGGRSVRTHKSRMSTKTGAAEHQSVVSAL
jgi:hypothetical protein